LSKPRLFIGKLLLAPLLVLLVLAVVAGGQIVTSLDLLDAVRNIDQVQLALRANGEALARLQEAESALQRFKAGGDGQQPGLRQVLREEALRLRAISRGMSAPPNFADAVNTDRELLHNVSSLLEQIGDGGQPALLYEDWRRTHGLLTERLKGRDQSYHLALAENAVDARLEAEAAIPVAILLTVVGVMAAMAASLAGTKALMTSFGRLAEAMRNLARGEVVATEAAARLGREFAEVSEALDLFQRMTLEKKAALEALAESEESLKRALDAAPAPLAMTRPGEGGLVYANKQCRDLFKVEKPLLGMDVRQFYTNPADRDRFVEEIRRRGELHEYEVSMRRADGEDRWMLVSAVPLTYRGEAVIVLGYSDITERRALLTQLQESEERLRLIVETTPVPLVLTSIATDRLLYVNRQALDLFHIPSGLEVIGMPASDFWADPAGRQKMKEEMQANQGRLSHFETRLKRPDGGWFWAQLSAASTDFKDEAVLLVSVEDVTKRRELEEELRRHATTDFLTGIANRRHFIDVAEREFARAKRYGHPLSVLMLDIDRFKRINDTYGHPVGDKVVQAMADLCRKSLREIDHLGRMGGEEFAILLPETEADVALQVAERVRVMVEEAAVAADGLAQPIRFTTSVGLASLETVNQGFDQMLMQADRALYKAKQAGRNCVRTAGALE
jgi:diguanylate cyclase (GGDEF)-like protein/PAS domain S-box-containing protein